jgi:hypothetical protein
VAVLTDPDQGDVHGGAGHHAAQLLQLPRGRGIYVVHYERHEVGHPLFQVAPEACGMVARQPDVLVQVEGIHPGPVHRAADQLGQGLQLRFAGGQQQPDPGSRAQGLVEPSRGLGGGMASQGPGVLTYDYAHRCSL